MNSIRLASSVKPFTNFNGSLKRYRSTVTALKQDVKPYHEIPGPKAMPLIGNAWRFLPVIGTFDMTNMNNMIVSLRKEYGDIVRLSNVPGRRDMLFVFDPETAETVYRNDGVWPERFQLESVKYFRTKVRKDFFGDNIGLVLEKGEKWQQMRTLVNQPLMQPKVVRLYTPKIDQVSMDFVERIKTLRNEKQELPKNFNNELNKWSLETISMIALDKRLGCFDSNLEADSDAQKMINAAKHIFDESFHLDLKPPIWKLISTPRLKRFVKYSNDFLEISLKHVEEARKKFRDDEPVETQSVLQRILSGDPSTKRAVIMAMDMMFAGIDTTSSTAAWTLYQIARNPEKQEKLYNEINKFLPNDGSPLTAEIVESMKYLKATIKEAFRLSPTTPGNARMLEKDVVLKNYLVPTGVDILIQHSLMYDVEENYPEAKKFVPERWLREASSDCPAHISQHKTHSFVYMPFGYGVRNCVGSRFANLEIQTLIIRILQKYRVEWHYPDLKPQFQFITKPADPLRFKLIERS